MMLSYVPHKQSKYFEYFNQEEINTFFDRVVEGHIKGKGLSEVGNEGLVRSLLSSGFSVAGNNNNNKETSAVSKEPIKIVAAGTSSELKGLSSFLK